MHLHCNALLNSHYSPSYLSVTTGSAFAMFWRLSTWTAPPSWLMPSLSSTPACRPADSAAVVQKFVGKDIEVSLMVVDREKYSFTASMTNAASDRILRNLRIGSLVWCRVRRMTDYGAFVSLENTFESALLHITNISWHRVPTIDTVFNEGDRLRAVVIGMDDGFSRLSVSTRDLEEEEGDMLRDPQAVYDNAERGVQRFLEHVAKWEADQGQEA